MPAEERDMRVTLREARPDDLAATLARVLNLLMLTIKS